MHQESRRSGADRRGRDQDVPGGLCCQKGSKEAVTGHDGHQGVSRVPRTPEAQVPWLLPDLPYQQCPETSN